MSATTFFAFLAKILGVASDWIKVIFKSKNGEIREASPNNIVKLAKNASARDINFNYYDDIGTEVP
jgi:hypothetical protein